MGDIRHSISFSNMRAFTFLLSFCLAIHFSAQAPWIANMKSGFGSDYDYSSSGWDYSSSDYSGYDYSTSGWDYSSSDYDYSGYDYSTSGWDYSSSDYDYSGYDYSTSGWD